MADQTPQRAPFQDAADLVSDALDADVLFLNTGIHRGIAANLTEICRKRARRTNVFVILVTSGGDAHAAYQIARCLQTSYTRCTLFLTGYCKSAGTLVSVGAHELVVAPTGELWPLDVQMSKPDELLLRQSGLTATAALSTLHEQAFEAFEHFFLSLIRKSQNAISTRTATHLAVQLTIGLFAPIYEHVEPMHVGEAGLALQVAEVYGRLLSATSGNIDAAALQQLATGFPSHDFVIDYQQIRRLFKHVRQPNSNEMALAEILGQLARTPSDSPFVAYLSTEGPRVQGLPGLGVTGSHAETAVADDSQPPAATEGGESDDVERGPTPAADTGTSPNAHVTSIGEVPRTPRARRRT